MVTVRVRRVKIALASPCPLQELFARAHERLTRFMPLWALLEHCICRQRCAAKYRY